MNDSTPPHVVWDDVPSAPLFDFGERVTFKSLTGALAQILHVEMKGGVIFPNPDDPEEREVHPNEQISTVVTGRMRLVMDQTEHLVGPGESIAIPPGRPHTSEFLEDTVLVEVFIPPIMPAAPADDA
jgi:quercetin dioxygenase-like cupin family protein